MHTPTATPTPSPPAHTPHTLPVPQVLLEVSHAVQHLHQMKLLHCDIKPENVLLKMDGTKPLGFVTKVGGGGWWCVLLCMVVHITKGLHRWLGGPLGAWLRIVCVGATAGVTCLGKARGLVRHGCLLCSSSSSRPMSPSCWGL